MVPQGGVGGDALREIRVLCVELMHLKLSPIPPAEHSSGKSPPFF